MKPYSLDLRARILAAYDAGEGTVRELAERFAVAPNTVQNYLTRRRTTGQIGPTPYVGGPPRRLDATAERALRALVAARNDRTDAEYADALARTTGCRVSARTLQRAWARLGFTRKKKTLHATEQDRPDVQRARRSFRRRARRRARERPRGRFIFVDEFGTNLGLTRRHARAPRGTRAVGAVPNNPDPNVTLTLGLSREGLVAPLALPGASDGAVFTTWVREALVPVLRPGDVVVADQVGAHRAHAARAAIEACGATYWLLPAYSPDLTPVEEAGSKVKAVIRGFNPRTVSALYGAMEAGLDAITPADARGWFSDRARYLSGRTKRTRPPL